MRVRVTGNDDRLDSLLARALPDHSRRLLHRLIQDRGVTLIREGRTQSTRDASLRISGELEIEIAKDFQTELEGEPKANLAPTTILDILFEDEGILVLNKPSGLASQPLPGKESETTALTFAIGHCPAIAKAGITPLEGGLLHRLDRDTSGALLFAKNFEIFKALRKAWKTERITKIYRAITSPPLDVTGKLPFLINTPLGRDQKNKGRMIAVVRDSDLRKIRGKPLLARTWVDQIKTDPSRERSDLELRIDTGVMHQIRCHLKSAGAPIVGDSKYGGAEAPRLWLHAWKIEIKDVMGREILVTAPLPEGWPS